MMYVSVIEIGSHICVHVFCPCFLNMLHIQTPVTHIHIMDYAFMYPKLFLDCNRATELTLDLSLPKGMRREISMALKKTF
jgi:hypothetical protein